MDMVDIVDFMENPWAPVDSSLFVAIPDICEFCEPLHYFGL